MRYLVTYRTHFDAKISIFLSIGCAAKNRKGKVNKLVTEFYTINLKNWFLWYGQNSEGMSGLKTTILYLKMLLQKICFIYFSASLRKSILMAIFKKKPETCIKIVPLFNPNFHWSYMTWATLSSLYLNFILRQPIAIFCTTCLVYLVIMIHLYESHWLSTAL